MTDDDDFLDGYLFDADDEPEPGIVRSLGLVVCMPIPPDRPELLNNFEERYRTSFKTPIMFVDVDETGRETLDNAAEFARAMGLDRLPTLAEAEAYVIERCSGPDPWTWD